MEFLVPIAKYQYLFSIIMSRNIDYSNVRVFKQNY